MCYVNGQSDVDFVVDMRPREHLTSTPRAAARKEVAPYAIVKHLCSKEQLAVVEGSFSELRRTTGSWWDKSRCACRTVASGLLQVHKFSSTQFTLLGSFEDAEGEGKEPSEKAWTMCLVSSGEPGVSRSHVHRKPSSAQGLAPRVTLFTSLSPRFERFRKRQEAPKGT